MAGTYVVEIAYKEGVVDPAARGLASDILHLHLAKPKRVQTAQLYRLSGDLSESERRRIASELLCDPVTQNFREVSDERSDGAAGRNHGGAGPIIVDVWYKAGVTDAVGDSVQKGIRDMDIEGVAAVRTGSRFRFWGLKNSADSDKIARALLYNPLVHERTIHVD